MVDVLSIALTRQYSREKTCCQYISHRYSEIQYFLVWGCKKVGTPCCGAWKSLCWGTQSCICKLEGPRPWMSPATARKRSDTPSVKHGCAWEAGKMLNCVGISREKQQTWLDLLTILLSWDTIMRKPVSVVVDVCVQADSQCVMMLMLHSFALSFNVSHTATRRE